MDPTVSTGPNELVTNSNVETGSIEIVYHEILIQNIKSGLRRCSIQFTIKNRSIANDQNSNFPTNSCSNSTTKWKFQSKSFQRFKVDCSPPLHKTRGRRGGGNEKSQPNGIDGKINFEPKVKERSKSKETESEEDETNEEGRWMASSISHCVSAFYLEIFRLLLRLSLSRLVERSITKTRTSKRPIKFEFPSFFPLPFSVGFRFSTHWKK